MLRDIENPSILRGNFFFFYNKSMFFLFIRIRLEPVVGKLVEKKEFIRHKYDTDKPCQLEKRSRRSRAASLSLLATQLATCFNSKSYRSRRVVGYTRDVIYFRKASRKGTYVGNDRVRSVSRYHRYERSRTLPIVRRYDIFFRTSATLSMDYE